ncbi:YciI family protein [Streptomyces sp. SAS_275]|uniref:YciI family protein n=1 Tax=Streptomyces sp. SAS_275 TaxID=3412746 RepID=UPI00403C5289
MLRKAAIQMEIMMQFALLVYRDASKDGEIDWLQAGKDYRNYVASLAAAGVMRGGQNLQPSPAGATVTIEEGKQKSTQGPHSSAPDQLGGFFIVECATQDEALEWAARCPGATHGKVEVRGVIPPRPQTD